MKRILVIAVATTALAVALPGVAQAKHGTPLATPANVCRAFLEFGAGGYTSYGNCVGHFNRDVRAFRFFADDGVTLISLDERCRQFEQGMTDPETGEFFQITYPFFFTEGGPEAGWPFPEYWAQNHRQCKNTLFAYHTLASTFGG